ncbi:YciI family protein [Methylobacterium sp. WL6]|uniref:YciI family protein n=1 Tax=Methylobacterium sp. WL6 TaxID=2603901 RepID=UPI0011C8CB5F|nr:YciI family protein [Methylobacterium sp. WL6]TXN66583.1 YciI family protein [Methylobacterium sp. WL6]
MPFIIETFDKPGHEHLRRAARAEHLAFLEVQAARLLACGAKLSDDGSDAGGGLYLVDVETRAEAERFIAEDPFAKAGLFERVAIQRWRKAYLDGRSYLKPQA